MNFYEIREKIAGLKPYGKGLIRFGGDIRVFDAWEVMDDDDDKKEMTALFLPNQVRTEYQEDDQADSQENDFEDRSNDFPGFILDFTMGQAFYCVLYEDGTYMFSIKKVKPMSDKDIRKEYAAYLNLDGEFAMTKEQLEILKELMSKCVSHPRTFLINRNILI